MRPQKNPQSRATCFQFDELPLRDEKLDRSRRSPSVSSETTILRRITFNWNQRNFTSSPQILLSRTRHNSRRLLRSDLTKAVIEMSRMSNVRKVKMLSFLSLFTILRSEMSGFFLRFGLFLRFVPCRISSHRVKSRNRNCCFALPSPPELDHLVYFILPIQRAPPPFPAGKISLKEVNGR